MAVPSVSDRRITREREPDRGEVAATLPRGDEAAIIKADLHPPEQRTLSMNDAPKTGGATLRARVTPWRADQLRWLLLGLVSGMLLMLSALLLHRMADITRGTPVRSVGSAPRAVDAPGFRLAAEVVGGVPLVAGHDVDLLVSGAETFERMFEELSRATTSITFQSYYCEPGWVADRLVAILTERALAGVAVYLIVDGFGCRRFAVRYGHELRTAGVRLAVLRPVRWYALHRAQHRSHVRIVVIDGRVGYTGGFGVDDKWYTPDGGGWRDTNARFTGPAVLQMQGAFSEAWAEARGELLAGAPLLGSEAWFAPGAAREAESASPAGEDRTSGGVPSPTGGDAQEPTGGVVAGIQFAGPGLGTTPFERLLFLAIGAARERVWISNPYFIPGGPLRRLLAETAQRGVDVRVITAGPLTDVPSARFAGRAYYSELVLAGVRIYEYQAVMMHAKTFVIDDRLALIGSLNLDNRSLRLNDELNLVVDDPEVGHRMNEVFADDLSRSTEITRHDVGAWSSLQRARYWVARRFAPLL
jgi:cardiolipin synthase A/B